jgi:hypothetical protein
MGPDQNFAWPGLGDWCLEALHDGGRPWLTKLDESHDQYLQEKNGRVFVLQRENNEVVSRPVKLRAKYDTVQLATLTAG